MLIAHLSVIPLGRAVLPQVGNRVLWYSCNFLMVREEGVEPSILAATAFEAVVYSCSTIRGYAAGRVGSEGFPLASGLIMRRRICPIEFRFKP